MCIKHKQVIEHKNAIKNKKKKYGGKCHTISKGRYCWICKGGPLHQVINNPFWKGN